MNKTLSLSKVVIDPTARDAEKEWKFWPLQFQDFVQLTVDPGIDLLKILRLFLTASTFENVQNCKSYDEVIAKLNEFYVKLKKRHFCKHTSRERHITNNLCHPGVTRMAHYARSKNLPYTIEEIQRMTISCRVCAELKPRFFKGDSEKLIKATIPFERLNIDFKRPLPSTSSNRYTLTVVDEYSRFPFALPWPDTSSQTVSKCLTQLFYLFGKPAYIYTDCGSSFMSNDLKTCLHSLGVVTSRTTAYNPQATNTCGYIPLYVVNNTGSCTNETTELNKQTRPPRRRRGEILEANPKYAHVRLTDGRETTVSARHLAPAGGKCIVEDGNSDEPKVRTGLPDEEDEKREKPGANDTTPENSKSEENTATNDKSHQKPPGHSTRIRRTPKRLENYAQH
ncbi:Uncharacterized protein T10_6152 [Trichinella papuae]|uniref:Integrase catalytic domain-containing protein n=1 Tax=Trichinella papuae TaxID=268474 RepID=A0A0V1MSG6_9BILA|nr:Uncharacterized protein T10_6152 [Trichinella papuae]